jgi:hypothetical protein
MGDREVRKPVDHSTSQFSLPASLLAGPGIARPSYPRALVAPALSLSYNARVCVTPPTHSAMLGAARMGAQSSSACANNEMIHPWNCRVALLRTVEPVSMVRQAESPLAFCFLDWGYATALATIVARSGLAGPDARPGAARSVPGPRAP